VKDFKWLPQVKGDPNGDSWEISVVRSDNEHGQKSWGWFDDRKFLVSHNGGPCRWPMYPGLGDTMIKIAHQVADELNRKNEPKKSNVKPCGCLEVDHSKPWACEAQYCEKCIPF
jgi:hypothetical protein